MCDADAGSTFSIFQLHKQFWTYAHQQSIQRHTVHKMQFYCNAQREFFLLLFLDMLLHMFINTIQL